MTVAELKAKLPEAEILSLSTDFVYIILYDPAFVGELAIQATLKSLDSNGVKALALMKRGENPLAIFELVGENTKHERS